MQQTRAIQYQQALAALKRAQEICRLPELTIDNAEAWQETFRAREQEATETLLQLEQKMSVAEAAHSQFEQAFELVCKIAGPVSRSEAGKPGGSCCATPPTSVIRPNSSLRCACASPKWNSVCASSMRRSVC